MLKELVKDQMNKYISDLNIKIKDESTKFEYFTAYNFLKKYEYSLNNLTDGVVDGGGDEGIDSIYIIIDDNVIGNELTTSEDFNNIINKKSDVKILIIQSKQESGFSEKAIVNLKVGLECIFENNDDLSNEKFRQKAELIRTLYKVYIEKGCIGKIMLNIYYCSLARSKEIAEENDRVLREKMKVTKYADSIGFIAEFNFVGCNELLNIFREPIEYRKTLKILKKFEYPKKSSNIVEGYLCLVNIIDYYKFILNEAGKIEDKIFEENIRDYQGVDEEVNTAIRGTLLGDNSNQFWCLNNGITIIAHNIKPLENELTMSNYQIVNGCQTSYTLFDVISSMEENNIINLEGELIIKVIELKEDTEGQWNEDLMLKIIESTNSQTKIDDFAFESHKPVHKRIEEYFKFMEEPLYYERKPKYYERRGFSKTSILNPFELFKAFYSIYYKAPSAVRNSPSAYFKEKNVQVFNLKNNLEFYGIAYKIYLYVSKKMIEMKESKCFDDDENVSFLIRNGVLHISRLVFAIKSKNEFKPNELTVSDITKVIDIEFYNEILSNQFNLDKEIETAIQILKKSILEIKREYGSLEKTMKSSKLDGIINKNVVSYIQTLKKVNQNLKLDEKNIIKRLKNIINSYNRAFRNISINGDLRYNFKVRLDAYIYWLDFYSNLESIYIKDLIAMLQETNNILLTYNRDSRIETAKEILKTTDLILERIQSVESLV